MKRYIASILMTSAAVTAPAVTAQDRAADAALPVETSAESQSGYAVEEIIVTAQRQAESSQRAAIAISVLQPQALAAVTNPENISRAVPALQMSGGNGPNPLIYVRGVGTFAANAYTDSAVAVNFDGVYLGRPSATYGLFYDLARVEVLKGPQGTLYGRNATGGALNIIPATPRLGQLAGGATVAIGNYDAVRAEAFVNIPVSDIAAIRVAGTSYTHDGYNTDGTFSEKGAGLRAQLLIQPSDALSIRLSGDYFDLGGTGSIGVPIGAINPFTGATTDFGQGIRVGPFDPRSEAIFNTIFVGSAGAMLGPLVARPRNGSQYYGAAAEVNADLGFGKLTVLASLRRNDQDYVTSTGNFVIFNKETDKQFSAEARLAGSSGSIDWLAGLFYFDETIDNFFYPHINLIAPVSNLKAKNRSYAGFGRVTWNIADTVRLTGAARYTKDERSFVGASTPVLAICQNAGGLCPDVRRLPADMSNIPAALASIGYVEVAPNFYADPSGSGSAYVVSSIPVNAKTSPNKLTYRAAVEFNPAPNSMLYASFETGYRAGGFSFSSIRPVFNPESIEAYTLGAKNRFLGGKLQLNVEAFLWKYKDQQLSHQSVGQNGGLEFVTENIGASTNKGIEVELTARPLRDTILHADVQYLNAKNGKFVFTEVDTSTLAGLPAGVIPPATVCPYTLSGGLYSVDCSNLRALRSPKWTINLGLQQSFPLTSEIKLTLEGGTHYQTSNIVMFERRSFSRQGAYWTSDASVTLGAADDKWYISAYVNNIENTEILTNSFYNTFNGVISGNYAAPRTYGVRMKFQF